MEAIHAALAKDLGRTKIETVLGDFSVIHEAVHAFNNVDKWVKPIKSSTTVAFQSMNPRVIPSPKG